MPTRAFIEQQRAELEAQLDLLSAKLKVLRQALAIEAGAAVKFQLEQQIAQAEAEREQIAARLDQLEGASSSPPTPPLEAAAPVAFTAGPRAALREKLIRHLSDGELRALCSDLDVDYEGLPGSGKADKARELLAYLERRLRLGDLLALLRSQRPEVDW